MRSPRCFTTPQLIALLTLAASTLLGSGAQAHNYHWAGLTSGFWNVADNWFDPQTGYGLPGATDDASNTTSYNITFLGDVLGPYLWQVRSFTAKNPNGPTGSLTVSQGELQVLTNLISYGNVTITGGVLSGYLSEKSSITAATLLLSGGELKSFTAQSVLYCSTDASNLLLDVKLGKGFDLSDGGRTRFFSTLDLGGVDSYLDHGAMLNCEVSDGLLDNGTIHAGAASSQRITVEGNGALTLGAGLTIEGATAEIGSHAITSGSNMLTNFGLIKCDKFAGHFTIDPDTFLNAYSGGATGRIYATDGGSVDVKPGAAWTNDGSLLATGADATGTQHSKIVLDTALTNTSNGAIDVANKGQIYLNANLTNQGTILAQSGTGQFFVNGVTIEGGTAVASNLMVFNRSLHNLLNGVTLGNGIDLSNGGVVTFKNDLDLNSQQSKLDNGAELVGLNDETLARAYITLGLNATQFITADASSRLTIGSGSQITGAGDIGGVVLNAGNNTIINDGTITGNVPGRPITVEPGAFNNGDGTLPGTLMASQGGSVEFRSHVTVTNGKGSSIQANGQGSVISLFSGSIINNGSINVNDGGTFNLPTGTKISNAATLLDASTNGTFNVKGGAIIGGTVGASNLMVFDTENNLLQHVTLSSGLDLSNGGRVIFGGGLDLGGSSNLNLSTLDNSAVLSTDTNPETLDNGTLQLGPNGIQRIAIDHTILTLGSGLTVDAKLGAVNPMAGIIGQFGGHNSLVNNGALLADESNCTITVAAYYFRNLGRIGANPGTVIIDPGGDFWSNRASGSLFANGTGSQLLLSGSIYNFAALDVTNNGKIVLRDGSSLIDTGAILANSTTGSLFLNNASIHGGTVQASNLLQFAQEPNLLDGVTLASGIDMNTKPEGGYTKFSNNLYLGVEDQPIVDGSMDNSATLEATQIETLDRGRIVFGAGGGKIVIDNGATLTFGSELHLTGANATIGNTSGVESLDNNGEIAPNLNGGLFSIALGGKLTNSGSLSASNGARLDVQAQSGWSNRGSITASGSGSLITLHGSPSNLNTNIGKMNVNAGGTITLETAGILNYGGTLLDSSSGGSLILHNSQIHGGTVVASNLMGFTQAGDATLLDGVHLGNGLDLSDGGRTHFKNGLWLGSGKETVLDNGALLISSNDQTLFGSSIRFAGDSTLEATGTTLTLDAALTLHGASGNIGSATHNYQETLINKGTINADASGDGLHILAGKFQNQGTVTTSNGGKLTIDAHQFAQNGTLHISNDLEVSALTFTQSNTGKTIVDAGAHLVLGNGMIVNGGKLTVDGAVDGSGLVTILGGELNGTGNVHIGVDNQSGTVNPKDDPGTLTIGGSYTQGSGGTLLTDLGKSSSSLLDVTGAASLSGALAIELFGGFRPTLGQSFTFLDYKSLTGGFDSVTSLNQGYQYSVQYGANGASLTVTQAAPVPESSTVLAYGGMLGLAAIKLLRCRRR